MRLPILLVLVLLTGQARAEDFATRFPQGSITTREQADAALKAGQLEEERQRKLFDARDAECYRAILVNDCREKVRRERELARRDVQRIELEAKDTKRRLDQQDLAKRRAEEEKQRAAEEAGRADKEAAARKQAEQRSSEAAAKAAAKTPGEAEQNRADYERKQQEHAAKLKQEQQDAAKRAQNAAEYQQKQVDAAKRAADAEAERKKREARRVERKQVLEKKEAEREALRKRAEEAAASATR
jgi:hypothetical protein